MTLVELELLLMWLHSELGLGPGRNNTLKFEGTSGKEGLSQTQNIDPRELGTYVTTMTVTTNVNIIL